MSKNKLNNRNLLSPTGFNFILTHSKSVDFYCNAANLPSINMGTAVQSSYLKDIDVPGDKIVYDDLVLQFLVDEDMVNYLEIYNWLMALGYPQSVGQTFDKYNRTYSDATMEILSSNYQPNLKINFKDIFPVSLSTIQFDAKNSDIEYVTAEATFKYKHYSIVDTKGNEY